MSSTRYCMYEYYYRYRGRILASCVWGDCARMMMIDSMMIHDDSIIFMTSK